MGEYKVKLVAPEGAAIRVLQGPRCVGPNGPVAQAHVLGCEGVA